MSASFTKDLPPQSHFAPAASVSDSGMYQASAPDFANSSTTLRFTAGSFSCLLHAEHTNTAIGTPQTRCREMHQSGRVSYRRLHRDEPLLRRPEDHRIVAAPAMWIGMLELLLMQEGPAALQQINDRLIGLKDLQAFILRQPVVNAPCSVHIAGRIKLVPHSSRKVLSSVRRSGVDDTGARVHGDVVRQHPQDVSI